MEKCPWPSLTHGLNLEGLCTYRHCPAYNSMVTVNLGIGEFDFARLTLRRTHRCPMCQNTIVPTKYGLSECQWWYVDHYSTRDYPLSIVHGTYELKELNCVYLIIETMPISINFQFSPQTQEATCPICLGDFDKAHKMTRLRCEHLFHLSCIDRWLQSNDGMANLCPVCRNFIIKRS